MSSNKKWYKLVFRQIQPIHIGQGSYGIINETRIFIPGWTMWGALTKRYGIKGNWKESDWENDDNKKIFENISCFYPCFDKEGKDRNVLFPNFYKGEFYLGNYSEDKFRAKFVDTFISTAINPGTNTASDESLHELNIILPKAKRDYRENEKEDQIYWVGVIKLEENIEVPDKIYIGGDVRYGLGRMVLENKIPLKNLQDNWKKRGGYIPVGAIYESPHELLVETIELWKGAEFKVKLMGDGFHYLPGSFESVSFEGFCKGRIKINSTSSGGERL